jgi:signal transduction histidine kinase
VNVFSSALDGLGRWYVAIPPVLIVVLLAALLLVTGAGQARLREAGERLENSSARQIRIDELESSLIQTINAQRSFLLTGDKSYLNRYEKYRADIEPQLERVRLSYADLEDSDADIRNLQILVGKRLADLGMVLDIQQKQGTAAAVSLIETSVGSDAGLAISGILAHMRSREVAEHVRADQHWYGSLGLSRWVTVACTLVNILLVLIATRLVYADVRRRNILTAELRDQKLLLEQEVTSRTRELVELSTHLQNLAEREKAGLARELHDELGGLLVGARMDISWAEQHLAKDDADLKARLHRVQQNLAAGIDLKRRIIEELRPTLLDNVGLFAALRWQLKETCGNAGMKCSETYPDEEPLFRAEASIALFRIAQEACRNIMQHAAAHSVSLSLEIDDTTLNLRIVDDGSGISEENFHGFASHGLASMRHRARALGGRVEISGRENGGTDIFVQIPIENVLAGNVVQAIP